MKRLFIAIELPAAVNSALSKLLPAVLPTDAGFRAVPTANRHVTVHFLGETHQDDIPLIAHKLSAIAAQFAPFNLYIYGVEPIADPGGLLRMVWAGIRPSDDFSTLACLVGEVLGHEPEHEPLPHITLARLKEVKKLPKEWAKSTFSAPIVLPVKKIEIWESILDSNGARYKSLQRFDLLG